MQENTFLTPEDNQELPDITKVEEELKSVRKGFFTFNINTILLLVLFAGLIVLYFLHFAGQPSGTQDSGPQAVTSSGKQLSVVFVNIDTLNEHYEFVKVLKNDLESTGQRMQNEVLKEQASLEAEAATFQRQIAGNAISEEKAKMVYEDLMMRNQQLMEKKERYTQMVAEQEITMNLRLLDTVNNFLKRFNARFGYDYIMAYKTAGEILIANDTLDITRSVLEELNKEYLKNKK